MNDIIKTVQALEDSNVLLKGVTKTTENETKEQKGGYVIRNSRCNFMRKFINWKRNCKSRI